MFSAVSQSIISIIFLVFSLAYLEKAVRIFCLSYHSFDNDNILPKHLLFSINFIFTDFNYLYPLSIHLVKLFIFPAFHYLYLLLIDSISLFIWLTLSFFAVFFISIHFPDYFFALFIYDLENILPNFTKNPTNIIIPFLLKFCAALNFIYRIYQILKFA